MFRRAAIGGAVVAVSTALSASPALARTGFRGCEPGQGTCLTLGFDHPAGQIAFLMLLVAFACLLGLFAGLASLRRRQALPAANGKDIVRRWFGLWRVPGLSTGERFLVLGTPPLILGLVIGIVLIFNTHASLQ